MNEIKYSRKFEKICNSSSRMKTPLGWIYWECDGNNSIFIPDPNHLWLLEDEDKTIEEAP